MRIAAPVSEPGLVVEQRQAALDQRQQLSEAEHVHARRRQLDRKRQAVHAPRDGDDQPSCLRVQLEARPSGARPLDEEADGRRVGIVPLSSPRTGSGLTVTRASPVTRRTSRLVVSTRTQGHPWSSASTTSRTSPSRRSHESNRTIASDCPQALDHLIELVAATGINGARQQPRDITRADRAREVDEPDAVGNLVLKRPDGLESDPRLADARRPGQRHDPVLGE